MDSSRRYPDAVARPLRNLRSPRGSVGPRELGKDPALFRVRASRRYPDAPILPASSRGGYGRAWQYSNAAYVLLGILIEEVTGQPYVDVVQKRVFDRAGMSSSGFFRLDEARPNIAIGYLPRPSPNAPWRSNIYRVPVIGGADGGAFSTTSDLDRFLHRVADGTLLGAMQGVVLARHADAGGGFHSGYGFLHYPDGRYGHGGGDPGVEVLIQRFPDDDVNLVVLCNMEGVAGDVRDAVLEAWRGPADRSHTPAFRCS